MCLREVPRSRLIGGAIALAAAITAVLLYVQGFGGTWQFDDEFSLKGLANVADLASAWDYVFGGTTGPGGRPLALASFLINASSWPDDPGAFRAVNLGLHLVNAGLLFLILRMLARQARNPKADQIALTASVIWLLSPFLASSVLSVVQRMAVLGAMFTLLGLYLYLQARSLLATRPRFALLGMSAALTICTVLGVLTKESAILLPLFAALIESLFPSPGTERQLRHTWLAWRAVFFLGPLVMISAYAAIKWPGFEITYQTRSFDLGQRLSSEAVILWEYLRQLLVPRPAGFGLFHDDVLPRDPQEPVVWLAAGAWLAAIALAMVLRKRQPCLALGVGGFLLGHLLESTVVPLELYFEHRNYVPAMFVYAALAALLWTTLPYRLAVLTSAAYAVVLAASLGGVTTLWGDSELAAEMWFEAHPASSRAAQFVSQQRLRAGYAESAADAIREASARAPRASDLLVQKLNLDCGIVSEARINEHFQELKVKLVDAYFSYAAIEAVVALERLVSEGNCKGLIHTAPSELTEVLLENRYFNASVLARDHLHNFLARMAAEQGDWNGAENHQRAAYVAAPTVENAQMVAVRLLQKGDARGAVAFLKEFRSQRNQERFSPASSRAFTDLDKLIESLDKLSRPGNNS